MYIGIQQMFIKHKYIITLYTLTRDTWVASAGWDYVSSYVVWDVCTHNPEDINNWEHITEESCYCMVVVLQQYGLFLWTFVFWNFDSIGLLILTMKVRVTATWSTCCAYRVFAFNKHLGDGTLVLKHGRWYVIWNVVCDWFYCFLISSFCWLKYGL